MSQKNWWHRLKDIFLKPKKEEPSPEGNIEKGFQDLREEVVEKQRMSNFYANHPSQPHQIFPASLKHLPELQQLYVNTIHKVNCHDYSPDQVRVWSSGVQNTKRWTDMITQQYVVTVQHWGVIMGFASLDKGTYIDFLYVHSNYQRLGIASALYEALEKEALRTGATVLTSDVSKTARPFFESKGFRVVAEQHFEKEGVGISNFKMEKQLFNG